MKQYHLRLCKGLSYCGAVTADRQKPDAYVDNEKAAKRLINSGYFVLVEVIDIADPEEAAAQDQDVDLAKMTVPWLKEYAAKNGIDLEDKTKKKDILAIIEEHFDDKPLMTEEPDDYELEAWDDETE